MSTNNVDVFFKKLGKVLVVAPSQQGKLAGFAQTRKVAFNLDEEPPTVTEGLTRWIFADFEKDTLQDQWGNPHDHQVHTLLVGTLQDGDNFLQGLRDNGLSLESPEQFFVPLQSIQLDDIEDSDKLRTLHPRVFALARRDTPSLKAILTSIRDATIVI